MAATYPKQRMTRDHNDIATTRAFPRAQGPVHPNLFVGRYPNAFKNLSDSLSGSYIFVKSGYLALISNPLF
ncbi:hypothetical protein NDU88_004533 [Pleurodeles waltl]|uniref:Uncharacterized protein n=1 Tax=Pleurodeles waltl TaxID=8319 RepID=A0AAV7W8E5_PLEWA|nr:hypothetical protein NDU88_004533 [Pleurodeles waltl]